MWLIAPLLLAISADAQIVQPNIFIRITQPRKNLVDVIDSRQYIAGSTCKACVLTLNGELVKVYPTGAFAIQLDLLPGDTMFNLEASLPQGGKFDQRLYYHFVPPPPAQADTVLTISSIITYPRGNLELSPGDIIRIRVKGLPGCNAQWLDHQPLYELPPDQAGGIGGIYQGEYTVRKNDSALLEHAAVTLTDSNGQQVSRRCPYRLSLIAATMPLVGMTIGPFPYLVYGLGKDRLGAAKMGYLDTAVLLHITGMVNNEYKVELSADHTAYIPAENVQLLPPGTFVPHALTASWDVYGQGRFDYVKVGLGEKLPYSSDEQPDPSRIIVNIYGASSNTSWITQMLNVREIKSVYYEQPESDVFRIYIELKHPLCWGYRIYYEGTSLVIQVKHPPEPAVLSHLRIAIDPGHGGSNLGALSPTGVYEKELTLDVAFDLKADLEKAGAAVFMTRTNDITLDMIPRLLMLQKDNPDLMVSIHMNASADPIHIRGTSTYYRYPGFRPLSKAIYDRMVQLGLHGFGNIGSFNFALNGPTDYPNALVEALFITNPGDEMKILDPAFRQKVAAAIMAGIQDYLALSKPVP